MQLEFLGTGGAVTIPRPACHCPLCEQARAHGAPYARTGPSLFLHGPDLLFDTPEESKAQLNRAGIDHIGGCFYSHWHPDHTMGRRVFESFFLGLSRHRWPQPAYPPVPVYLPEQVARDFDRYLGLRQHLDFMAAQGWVMVHRLAEGGAVRFGDLTVRPVLLAAPYVYAFLIERAGLRLLIAMDELIGWEPPAWLAGLDAAVLPMGVVEFDPFTGERRMPADHPLLAEEATFRQAIRVVKTLSPRQVYWSSKTTTTSWSFIAVISCPPWKQSSRKHGASRKKASRTFAFL